MNSHESIEVKATLNWLYSETSNESLVRRFAEDILGNYNDQKECDVCGFRVPVSDEDQCLICGTAVQKDFCVTFQFSVNVKAKDESTAESEAKEAVDVTVQTSYTVEDNYDLLVYNTYEA